MVLYRDILQTQSLPYIIETGVIHVIVFVWQVGKTKAQAALSLVGYDDELRPAMEYVFGSTFVCDTLENAKKVSIIIIQQHYIMTWYSHGMCNKAAQFGDILQ